MRSVRARLRRGANQQLLAAAACKWMTHCAVPSSRKAAMLSSAPVHAFPSSLSTRTGVTCVNLSPVGRSSGGNTPLTTIAVWGPSRRHLISRLLRHVVRVRQLLCRVDVEHGPIPDREISTAGGRDELAYLCRHNPGFVEQREELWVPAGALEGAHSPGHRRNVGRPGQQTARGRNLYVAITSEACLQGCQEAIGQPRQHRVINTVCTATVRGLATAAAAAAAAMYPGSRIRLEM
jgi:hypothetical protein